MSSHGAYQEEKDIGNRVSSTNKEDDDAISEFERVHSIFYVSRMRRVGMNVGNAIEYYRIIVRP